MKNLYFILSNKGRMGDTELRYVNGELAHVNENEAYILDKYGKTGEDFIKQNGSGTINPETGLKEYFIIEGLTAAKFAYDLYKGNEQRKAGERVSKEIEKQIGSLQGQYDDIDLNNQSTRNRNASARQTELNNGELSRVMNDNLAMLNEGTAYRNLPANLVQGGLTRRFGSNSTLFKDSDFS